MIRAATHHSDNVELLEDEVHEASRHNKCNGCYGTGAQAKGKYWAPGPRTQLNEHQAQSVFSAPKLSSDQGMTMKDAFAILFPFESPSWNSGELPSSRHSDSTYSSCSSQSLRHSTSPREPITAIVLLICGTATDMPVVRQTLFSLLFLRILIRHL